MKRLAAIICNYNKASMVTQCIDALFEQKYQDFDLYVVDNGSTDESLEKISAYGKALTLFANTENLGGSGGFNTGLRACYEIPSLGFSTIFL